MGKTVPKSEFTELKGLDRISAAVPLNLSPAPFGFRSSADFRG